MNLSLSPLTANPSQVFLIAFSVAYWLSLVQLVEIVIF